MGWTGGRGLKSQTFSVFRNRRYEPFPEHLWSFVMRRWRGDFQVSLILYFSLVVWKYFPNVPILAGIVAAPWQTAHGFGCLEAVHFTQCTASYLKPFHPPKWGHIAWQGWGFSQFPQECANVDFIAGFLPRTSSGKNLYHLNLLPFITSFLSIPSPQNFLSF